MYNYCMMKNNYLAIKSKPKYFLFLFAYFCMYPFCKLMYGKRKNWLICERGDDAQDNGYVFFKYLVNNHPEIKATYLIHKKSNAYKNVASIGNVVEFGSIKHLLMVIGCPVKISTHLFGYAPWIALSIYYRRNKTRDKHVFLQHGIIKNFHEGLCGDVCKSLDLFVCGAKPEHDYIMHSFGYNNGVPKYLGLARYDMLFDCSISNQIIIMPTWRQLLSKANEIDFLNSSFYNNWNSLINDEELIRFCLVKKIKIKFYLHYSLQKFSYLFKSNEIVDILNFGEETVQTLLKESKLLITDFSSVFFDFAYMKKPVIYFQFDESTFFDEHYSKGYFDYRKDGFGDVCLNVKTVVNSIERSIGKDFRVEKTYIDRIEKYFPYRDCNNSKRIFEAIKHLN